MNTYNPRIPQATDLPSDSQLDIESNFLNLNEVYGEDHVPFGNLIEEATLAAPIVITSTNHRLTTGNTVTVFNMEGLNDKNVPEDWTINGSAFVVTVIDDDTFSLDGSDSTTFPTYIANSGDFSSVSLPYGSHTKNFFPTIQQNPPNRNTPKSAYFTQNIDNLAELFFQNGSTLADSLQMTNLAVAITTNVGKGFVTPWGWIVNMGEVIAVANTFTTFNYPLAFTNRVYSFTITRGRIRASSAAGTRNPVGSSLSNTQFQVRYANDVSNNFVTRIKFIAIGE